MSSMWRRTHYGRAQLLALAQDLDGLCMSKLCQKIRRIRASEGYSSKAIHGRKKFLTDDRTRAKNNAICNHSQEKLRRGLRPFTYAPRPRSRSFVVLVRSCEDYFSRVPSATIDTQSSGGFLEGDDSYGCSCFKFDSFFAVVVFG